MVNPMENSIKDVILTIKSLILRGQTEAAKSVNNIQLIVYYHIGCCISANSGKPFWGTNALKQISDTLKTQLPGLRGFSVSSLKNMRAFYEEWKCIGDTFWPIAIGQKKENKSPIAIGEFELFDYEKNKLIKNAEPDFPWDVFFQVSFTHHIRIIEKVKTKEERYYYIRKSAQEKISVDVLSKMMDAGEYHAQKMPSNFSRTVANEQMMFKALDMFKDSYLLDFINTEEIEIRDKEDMDERIVEKEIVHNIKKFIMTFGYDFAFVGNQYHLEAFSQEFFPDMLFFNRELNCLVVIELKTGNFKAGYLAQLMTYLRILDDKVKKPHENPSIGIVLCKNADKDFVEYVIQDYAKPMGVATYRLNSEMPERLREVLPDVEELRKLL